MYKYQDQDVFFNDDYYRFVNKYQDINIKRRIVSDEELLEKMDIKTIENFLRKKKLKNINK